MLLAMFVLYIYCTNLTISMVVLKQNLYIRIVIQQTLNIVVFYDDLKLATNIQIG